VLDREKARRAAEEFLRKVIQPRVAEELVIAELEEFPTCWVADYTTRKFMQAGSLRHALAGNGPLIINRRTGAIRVGLTSKPVEDQLDHD
jgi:hypothetical protein